MAFYGKSLPDITDADLLVLITDEVRESKTIEFKVILPGNSDDEKREFLADISSFANASGGFIIYGMAEEGGRAISLPGISSNDPDADVLRLESSIREGVQPRIPGFETRYIGLANGKYAFVLSIPRSFASPHMITFKNLSRFFGRNSAGKFQLDVQEIRQAFLLTDSINERVRNFRLDRLGKIIARETPVPMDEGAKVILHLVPLTTFQTNSSVDLKSAYEDRFKLETLSGPPNSFRYNLDGIVSSVSMKEGQPVSYVQIFRNGIMEAVDNYVLRGGPQNYIPHKDFEWGVISTSAKLLDVQGLMGITTPIIVFLSMTGVKGYSLLTKQELKFRFPGYSQFLAVIDRDVLLLPEVLIDSLDNLNTSCLLHPIFDAVWNATGLPGSINYDQDGNWTEG